MQWWMYQHNNGQQIVKRYFGPEDITTDLKDNPFALWYYGPIEAPDKAEAERLLKQIAYAGGD